MDVCLLSPSVQETRRYHQMPIGMLYAASELMNNGHQVSYFDLRQQSLIPSDVRNRLRDAELIVVATTDYDDAQCYPIKIDSVNRFINSLKTTDTPIYLVGSHGTVKPEQTLRKISADGILKGEHETVIPSFVEAFSGFDSLPRTWPERPLNTPPDKLREFDPPAYDLAPLDSYASEVINPESGTLTRDRSGLILANRGCPFACNFCHLLFGEDLRVRPVSKVLKELEILVETHGFRHVFFLDYTFTLNEDWVRELCSELEKRSWPLTWVAQTRLECIDPDLLGTMRSAGCTGLWLGLETPSQSQRSFVSKGHIEDDEMREAVGMVHDQGIVPLSFLMVGFPDETEESLRRMNDMVRELDIYYTISRLTPLPGTDMFEDEGLDDVFRERGWDYADHLDNGCLGLSDLPLDDLQWFFDFHRDHPRRLSNALKKSGQRTN